MHMKPFIHGAYREAYLEDEDFKEVYQQLQSQSYVHDDNSTIVYHIQDGLPYMMDKLCVPKGDHLQVIKEAQTSMVLGHFGVWKIIVNL